MIEQNSFGLPCDCFIHLGVWMVFLQHVDKSSRIVDKCSCLLPVVLPALETLPLQMQLCVANLLDVCIWVDLPSHTEHMGCKVYPCVHSMLAENVGISVSHLHLSFQVLVCILGRDILCTYQKA